MTATRQSKPARLDGSRAILLATLFLFPAILVAETLHVQTDRAALLEQPALGSTEVAPLSKGTTLESLERDGSWYRVEYGDREGWVSRLFVGAQPPMERSGILDDEEVDMDDPRRRPSEIATAAAARGLTPQERQRLSDAGVADYDSLERVEDLELDPGERRRFAEVLAQ